MPPTPSTGGLFRRLTGGSLGLKILPFAVLALVFLTLYHHTGHKLKESEMYSRNDVFFRTDTYRALMDMVGERTGSRGRTSVHPIFVMSHQPVGELLTDYHRTKPGMKKAEAIRLASIAMTAAAGTGTVLFIYATLLAMGLPALRALLFAAMLGASATQMFFSSAPETYIFSSLGLAGVAYFAVRSSTGHLGFQAASVYAVGCLTSNLVPVTLWCAARHWQGWSGLWKLIRRVALALAITIGLLIVLSVIQKWIYPQAAYFFVPSSALDEVSWLYWENLKTPFTTARILLQHLWLSNIIGPEPVLQMFMGKSMASIEQGHWESFQPALALYVAWSLFLLTSASSLFSRATYTAPFLAALGCLAFNFFFHSVFGNDRMLYSADWTIYSVIAVAWGFEVFLKRVPALARASTALLALLVIAVMMHNWRFLDKILALVQNAS